ncbi:MAG: DNA polymerase III subunit delta [Firmicutes bacterium]|nr:DNA polymerase III subunit delta [Bacillota bacterium]
MSKRQELDANRLKHEIKTGIKRPVYLFYGQEDFLIEEAVNAVANAVLPAGRNDTSCTLLQGTETTLQEVLDMADTVSLFSSKRLIIVADAPYFAKSSGISPEQTARLLNLSKKKEADAYLIFYAAEISRSLKIVKELAAAGALYRFDTLRNTAIMAWLREKMAGYGKRADTKVLQLFLAQVGTDLRTLTVELEKLVTFLGKQAEITEESIEAVCARNIQTNIFALIDAVVYGKTPQALRLLQDLLAVGEPPLRILSMLVRQFRLIGEAKELWAAGERRLAAALSLKPYAAQILSKQAQQVSATQLKYALTLLLQCELDIKQGRIEPVLALETLIVALGQQAS